MSTFEDLRAFQRALNLMVDVYTATNAFPKQELYGLTSQLRRASCSVVSHIAEGQGRLTFGERRQMFSHARGSLFEVEAQVIASLRLGFIDVASATHLRHQATLAAREIAGLIEWIKAREAEAKRPTRRKPRKPDA